MDLRNCQHVIHGKVEHGTNHCFIGVTPIILSFLQEHTGSTKLSTCYYMVRKSIERITVSLV